MNIGIDARILERKMTGIGRFLVTFLNELPNIDHQNKYYLYYYNSVDIHSDFYTNVSTVKCFLPQKLFSPIWNNFILPRYLKKNKIDLFFSVNQLIPLIRTKKIKFILVLHDVIFKVDKSFHPFLYRKYLQFFTYFSIKNSDLIITVSKYSKKDIIKYYNINENKIIVIYEAIDKEFGILNLTENEKKEIRDRYNLSEHIILYVGKIENRKNIKGILTIADEVYQRNKDISFVMIGNIGYGGKKLLYEMKKRKNIVYMQSVEDELLKKLYNISLVFLFPSYYEGFGFPPLEAMQSGLPVISADNTSLKEVVDSGGLLHDANDSKAFVDDIFKLIEDKDFYISIRNRGIIRANNFNINTTVNELVKVFNSFS